MTHVGICLKGGMLPLIFSIKVRCMKACRELKCMSNTQNIKFF